MEGEAIDMDTENPNTTSTHPAISTKLVLVENEEMSGYNEVYLRTQSLKCQLRVRMTCEERLDSQVSVSKG